MPRVHSHYDNLKIPRDASPEAIRAAYRALTRQHHPDRNPDDDESARIMALVNVAYSVLSDPSKRSEHDEWIHRSEAFDPLAARPVVYRTTAHVPRPPGALARGPRPAARKTESGWRPWRRAIGLGIVGAGALWGGSLAIERWQYGGGPRAVLTPSLSGRGGTPSSTGEGWVRSPLAPNGRSWPEASGYLEAYPQLNRTGLSEVTADNRENADDVLVKLVSLDGPTPLPVRTALVTRHARFVLKEVTNGTYDLRWRNLKTGALMRTPPFILEEVSTARGLQATRTTVEIDARGGGGSGPRPYALGDADF